MRERQVLECIEKIAIMEFHRTGDKWWQKIADAVAEKKKVRRWWQK